MNSYIYRQQSIKSYLLAIEFDICYYINIKNNFKIYQIRKR